MSQIEFKDVTKEYLDTKALEEISFSVDDGEFVFLIGPSGAGKSTLIKMLIREEMPSSGEVLYKGMNVPQIPRDEICTLRRSIGVVFQDFKLLSSRNVFENVAIATEVVDSPKEVINSVVPNVLNMVGLLDKRDKFPNQLSGGEKQRLSIARALAHEPDVLVADEPTGMIDPKAVSELMDLLVKINELGTTIIMATHDEAIVDKFAKRVVKLENGRIAFDKIGSKYNG